MEFKLINKHPNDVKASESLEQLATIMEQETDILVKREYGLSQLGKKIALIESLTLVVLSINVLISIITLWISLHPNYTVTIQGDNQSLTIETKYKEEAVALLMGGESSDLKLLLEKKVNEELNSEAGEEKN